MSRLINITSGSSLYYMGQRGSQWNGPNWPYQTSLVLTGPANFINNYKQDVITPDDYVRLLRLYAGQHYLPDGKLNLVENYDPDLGGPIAIIIRAIIIIILHLIISS